jgi:hypothetical protein
MLQFHPLSDDSECLRFINEPRLRDFVLGLYNLNMLQKTLSNQGYAHNVLPVIEVPTPRDNFGVFGGHVLNVAVGIVAAVNLLD